MNQAENLIKIYETGFQICLVLAILFLAVTAVLFWRFRILHMIRNRTGRAQRKAIEQMKEANEPYFFLMKGGGFIDIQK